MSVSKRLTEVFHRSPELPFDSHSKIVTISDCHRGTGTWADDFLANQNLFYAALTYYYKKGFTYIELGDGDELWGNRKLSAIIATHRDAFHLMAQFHKEGRFHMLFGNHDMGKKHLSPSCYPCDYDCLPRKNAIKNSLFSDMQIHEGLVLKCRETGKKIFLVHGHQGGLLNDTLWKVARFLVRYVWKPLELMGFHDPTSAAKNYQMKKVSERKLAEWSKENNQMLIAGHTHRPAFPKPGETLYFNDGSCVHPRSITSMEIENHAISLIKWSVATREDRTMYVNRQVMEPPVPLKDYFQGVIES